MGYVTYAMGYKAEICRTVLRGAVDPMRNEYSAVCTMFVSKRFFCSCVLWYYDSDSKNGGKNEMTKSDLISMRAALSMSQAELADAVGVHKSTVLRWESGETPIPKMLELAMQTLGVGDKLGTVSELTVRQLDDLVAWFRRPRTEVIALLVGMATAVTSIKAARPAPSAKKSGGPNKWMTPAERWIREKVLPAYSDLDTCPRCEQPTPSKELPVCVWCDGPDAAPWFVVE